MRHFENTPARRVSSPEMIVRTTSLHSHSQAETFATASDHSAFEDPTLTRSNPSLQFPAVSMLTSLLQTGRNMHGEALRNYAENYPHWSCSKRVPPWADVTQGLYKSGYGDPLGWKPLREHLATRDAAKRSAPYLSLDNIAVTQGGTHALYSVLQAFARPDSEVLLPAPGYTGYRDICRTLKLKHRPYAVDPSPERQTHELMQSLRPSSIIIINSPHNPSGTQMRTAQLEQFVQAARRAGSLALFDVVYDDLVYEGDPPQWSSIFGTASDCASCIWVNSFSKNYALPALRMGWITATAATILKLEPVLESSVLCSPALNQELALAALRRGSGALAAEMKARRDFLCHRLASISGLEFKCPPAGLSVMVRLHNRPAIDLVQRLLEERAVLLLPGNAYYCGDLWTVRLSFGYPRGAIQDYTSMLSEIVSRESPALQMEPTKCISSA